MADGDVLANQLFISLTAGAGFEIPDFDFEGDEFQPPDLGQAGQPIVPPENGDLTEGTVDGNGTFDQIMKGIKAQLKGEWDANRITGAEYTKAYIALTQSALAAAVQYLLGKDQAYWGAVTAQIGASTARVQLETAKAQAALVQAQIIEIEAQYALTKMKLATEEVQYDMGVFNVSDLGPQQRDLVVEQRQAARAQTLDMRSDNAPVAGLMGKQKDMISEQIKASKEQTETARAQTLDTRTDGATVAGAVGKQKALYEQQITSYKRDAETKLAKIITDAWVTQKTLDEGLEPPATFTNAELDEVMNIVRTNLNLGTAS